VIYANRLWTGLTVFLDQPDVPMHTNDVERAIRGPAVGRKNHYGSKNLESARVAAVWYSVVATCKQSGIRPREYIVDTLKAILTRKPVLMPWEWRPAGLMENVLGTD
jgi:transposase